MATGSFGFVGQSVAKQPRSDKVSKFSSKMQ
jgi:hypothetical protein